MVVFKADLKIVPPASFYCYILADPNIVPPFLFLGNFGILIIAAAVSENAASSTPWQRT